MSETSPNRQKIVQEGFWESFKRSFPRETPSDYQTMMRSYVSFWLFMALVSVGYISLMLLFPETTTDRLFSWIGLSPTVESAKAGNENSPIASQVKRLKRDLKIAHAEVARLKEQLENTKQTSFVSSTTDMVSSKKAIYHKERQTIREPDQKSSLHTQTKRLPSQPASSDDLGQELTAIPGVQLILPLEPNRGDYKILNASSKTRSQNLEADPSRTGEFRQESDGTNTPKKNDETPVASQLNKQVESSPSQEPQKTVVSLASIPLPPERQAPPVEITTAEKSTQQKSTDKSAEHQKIQTASVLPTRSLESENSALPKSVGSIFLAVELSTSSSIHVLRASWNRLLKRYKPQLYGLQPRYVRNTPQNVSSSGSSGRKYTLIAGPLSSISDTDKICQVFHKDGLPCEPSIFSGRSLENL